MRGKITRGDSEITNEEEWHYPKPRFKYGWVMWTGFVIIVFYIFSGFVQSGEASWWEVILFTFCIAILPGTGCYKVRKIPEGEVPVDNAEREIETDRAIQKEDIE